MEIEQVISELSKIDSAGQSILDSAKAENENYEQKIAHEKELFASNLKKDLEEYLDSYRQNLESENIKIIEQLRSDTEHEIHQLEDAFEKEHTAIAMEIFNSLIKE